MTARKCGESPAKGKNLNLFFGAKPCLVYNERTAWEHESKQCGHSREYFGLRIAAEKKEPICHN